MSIDLFFEGFFVYILVFVRFAGMIAFNPYLARTGLPAGIRVAVAVCFTLLVAPIQPVAAVAAMTGVDYFFAMLRELFLGYVYGYVFQIYYYFLLLAGDLIDNDIGLQMAKTFDPTTNQQTSITGYILLMVFTMVFFLSGSHLALFRMYLTSFSLIPVGAEGISTNIFGFCIELFTTVFSLVLRLVAPFMVAAVILQASLGVLMKFIPQVTVFVINFQLRIGLGLILLFSFAPFVGQFIDNYIDGFFDNLNGAIQVLATGAV